jgi:hypothetical protein
VEEMIRKAGSMLRSHIMANHLYWKRQLQDLRGARRCLWIPKKKDNTESKQIFQ